MAKPSSTGHWTFPRGTFTGFVLRLTLWFDHRPSRRVTGTAEGGPGAPVERDRNDDEVRSVFNGAGLPALHEASAEGEGGMVGQGRRNRRGQLQ